MKVSVRYFAVLRDERGVGEEDVTTEATTATGLYEELRTRHGFALPSALVTSVVNGVAEQTDQTLNEGDNVVFLPPVSGG